MVLITAGEANMEQRFFYVTGSIFFVVASCMVTWLAVVERTR